MLTIIDYGVGNLGSIQNMLRKNGIQSRISGDPEAVLSAGKLILPGVGAFDHCMSMLRQSGLLHPLEKKVLSEQVPVLGICVGMQMMAKRSEEGSMPGLGWLDAEVIRFDQSMLSAEMKIPHMGWSEVQAVRPNRLLENMDETPRFYFVHSYHMRCSNPHDETMLAVYGYPFTAAIEKDNLSGVQFHPEKSHRFGLQLLRNFAEKY